MRLGSGSWLSTYSFFLDEKKNQPSEIDSKKTNNKKKGLLVDNPFAKRNEKYWPWVDALFQIIHQPDGRRESESDSRRGHRQHDADQYAKLSKKKTKRDW